MTLNSFRQYIAGYTVANLWRYPIRRRVTNSSALECSYVSCLSLLFCLVCSLQLCCHLLGKSWPLGSIVFYFCDFPLIYEIIHIKTKGEVCTVKHVQALQYFILLTVPRQCFFCGPLKLQCSYVSCLSLLCCLVCSLQLCGHLLGKGWPLGSFVCVVFVTFPCVSWSASELKVRLVPLNMFKHSSILFYWLFQGGASFVDRFSNNVVMFHFCLCYAV